MTDTPDARAAIAALQGHEAWAIIRRSTRAGDRDTVGLVGGRRSVVESLLDVPLEDGRARGRPHRRPAAGGAVPAGARARVRGARRRHPAGRGRHRDRAGVLGRRGRRRRSTTPGSSSPTAAASRPTTRSTPRSSRRSSTTRSARARAPTSSSAGTTARTVADWGADKALTVFRRLLERERGAYWTYCLLHRRPLPDRRQPRAARVDPRRRRPDEPDQRHLPAPARAEAPTCKARAAGVPRRREGDLRALHGRRRGAQDDVRHLPRGRPGARARSSSR